MSTFQKRETNREVKILGQCYTVDFGRDSIAFILKRVQVALEKMEDKNRADLAQAEHFNEMMEEEKTVLKGAIGEILGCHEQVDAIFKGDDTAILHRDVYTFLVEEYIEVMKPKSPYNVERIEGI